MALPAFPVIDASQMQRVVDGRYCNLHRHPKRGYWDLLRWKFGLGPRERASIDATVLPKSYVADAVPVDREKIRRIDRESIQLTWIGHATFLLQVAGLNFLTDPVFAKFAAPWPTWAFRRRAPLPLKLTELPTIHGVLLSHNHYDHLDARVVKFLPNDVTWFVPLGLAAWFRQRGVENLVELDWWQEAEFGPVSVVSVPAQHFSARTPFDRNLTLWCGFVLRTQLGNIYFAGDSGYSPVFADIGMHLGPMRLSMIPIGAYQPRWFMAPVHLNPEEAVKVHLDVKSEFSVAMHWGTFALTDEPMAEPPIALRHQLARRHLPATAFRTLRFGETVVV